MIVPEKKSALFEEDADLTWFWDACLLGHVYFLCRKILIFLEMTTDLSTARNGPRHPCEGTGMFADR